MKRGHMLSKERHSILGKGAIHRTFKEKMGPIG